MNNRERNLLFVLVIAVLCLLMSFRYSQDDATRNKIAGGRIAQRRVTVPMDIAAKKDTDTQSPSDASSGSHSHTAHGGGELSVSSRSSASTRKDNSPQTNTTRRSLLSPPQHSDKTHAHARTDVHVRVPVSGHNWDVEVEVKALHSAALKPFTQYLYPPKNDLVDCDIASPKDSKEAVITLNLTYTKALRCEQKHMPHIHIHTHTHTHNATHTHTPMFSYFEGNTLHIHPFCNGTVYYQTSDGLLSNPVRRAKAAVIPNVQAEQVSFTYRTLSTCAYVHVCLSCVTCVFCVCVFVCVRAVMCVCVWCNDVVYSYYVSTQLMLYGV